MQIGEHRQSSSTAKSRAAEQHRLRRRRWHVDQRRIRIAHFETSVAVLDLPLAIGHAHAHVLGGEKERIPDFLQIAGRLVEKAAEFVVRF